MMLSTGQRVLQRKEEVCKRKQRQKLHKVSRFETQQQKYLSEKEEVAEGTSGEEDEDEEEDDRGDG